MSEQDDSGEDGGPAKITADEDYKLEVNGFRCPDAFLTQFTPLEFEELVANFLEFDTNKSGTIDIYEIRKILHHMEMDITKESAQELMDLIDGDGSGEIDFVEFCAFIALTKRGDDKYTKFGKLLEKLGSSPMGMLEQQAKARHFKTRFVLIEEREATATTPSLVVIELLIEGQWFSRDEGETKGKFEIKRFQGMGPDSRHAKDAAIKLALVKLKSYMPGAHLKDGEFPAEWMTWVSNNISRGVTAVDIIETLVRKGFKPTFNDTVMHSLITSAYFDVFLQENPEFSCESLMATTLDIKFVNWLKSLGAMGLDGQIILQTLEERDIQLRLYQPAVADKLKYNQLSSLLDFNGKEPKLLDFHTACQDGNVIAVDLYIRGDVDVNLEKMSRFGSLSRTALMLASSGNHSKVVELLIANKANVLAIDRRGRSALHYAAINGSLETCELLMNAGAPLFLGDNQGNTPLHLATWQNHPPTVDFLCGKGQEFTRSITSNKVLVNPGQTFDDLSRLIFQEMQNLKLRATETQRFQKIWLYEASELFRQKMSSNVRHMIAPTCQEIMEDVLHRFDPRPETGIFVSTAIEDEQLFIPTISSHHELTVLLQYMFRQSALDNTNNWNRTPLHLACDKNKIASHLETILLLIHKHGCNVMLKDMHHKTPYDLLIADRNGVGTGTGTGGPTATSLREKLIYENRVEKILEIMSKFEETDREKLTLKRNQILEECMRRAEEMNSDLWEATRLASLLTGVYGKRKSLDSLAMATVTGGEGGEGRLWSHYIDLDTKNEFFCCQPKDISLGDRFSEFSWKLPEAIRQVFHHDTAFLYQKISQSTVLRQIENWVTLKSSRYSIVYYLNAETEEYSFLEPSVYQWKTVARGATFQATYGYGEEWQEYLKDNLIFYFNKLTRVYCWDKPVEAVTVSPAERFCTAYKKKNRRIDQKWYTCEQCNKELKALEDAAKASAAAAAAEGNENSLIPPAPPPPVGKASGSSMLRICEPCVYRCHRGHKGVRLVRISPISCGCHSVCQPVNRCCAQEMSTLQAQNIKAAHHESLETQRTQLYNLLMPPTFALVPKHDPVTGKVKKESGFMMCRKPPPRNRLLEQIITTRSLSCVFSSSEDHPPSDLGRPSVASPSRTKNESDGLTVATDEEKSIVSDSTQALTSIPPGNGAGGVSGDGSTTVYIQELENQIIGNLYSDDRHLSPSSPTAPALPEGEASTSLTLPPQSSLSTAEIIAYLHRHPELLQSDELSEDHLSQGWIVAMDSEEPEEYEPGTKVICTSRQHSIPCYGTIVRYLMSGVYLVKFFDGHEEKLSFESIESVRRRKFYHNTVTGYSSWDLPSPHNKGEEGEEAKDPKTFGQPPEPMELTGNDWNSLKLISNERRSFQNYDEYEDPFTKLVFYVHPEQHFLEQQVLKIQNLYRIKHHKTRVLSWQSSAFTFQKPVSVFAEEKVKAGWALLRRRSRCLGEFMDVEQYEWEELMDEDSADFFYWQEDTDHYTWTKPQIPHTKYQTKILPLEVGEKVTFLFPGKAREEEAIVTRIRKDDETGEDKYDIQHCRQESVRHQWIERYRLKKIAKTGEELKLALSAKEWKKQIRRQREKEKRIKLLIRQKKQQEELEKRSKVLVVKRHQTAAGGMSVASSQDEMEKGRILRSRVEKSQLEEERDAVIRQKRAEAIEAMMRDMNTGKMKLSKSEMISLQRSITMRLEVEGMRNKRTAAQNVLLEKRKETKRRLEVLERSLRVQEDLMTTPRSSVRRRLLRQVHFGVLRQIRGQVICEWGCGDWVMLGQEQQDHQRNYCSRRIVACPLGCMKKLTEDEWLAPYVAPRDIASEEENNFGTVAPAGAVKVTPLNQTQPANGVIVSSDSDDDRRHQGRRPDHQHQHHHQQPVSTQEHHETHECPKRLVPCPRQCLEWVCAEVLDHHMTELCVKREAKPIECRLGCGELFGGTIEQLISAEEERFEHETEECPYRLIRCTWRNLDGSYCAAQIQATERDTHRNEHIQKLGISTYVVPGTYVYKVQPKCFMVKIQLWGGGGGSGHFFERKGGAGGGGGFVELILLVNPFDIFEVTVGSGGQAGVYGTEIQAIQTHREDGGADGVGDGEKLFDVIDGTVGVSLGGNPGGGVGYGGGGRWASGGGGGYSMVAKRTSDGNEVIAVAGGGGGGGSQDGLPGCGMTGPYPGSRIDPRNGCCAIGEQGGVAGDSGNIHFSDFPATNGMAWQGGNGCQFGAGGGGGYAGGGGGGTSPGVGGGGGGGSSFVYTEAVRDHQFIHGTGRMPGGLQHDPPEAVGVGEWDKVGGVCGEGGDGHPLKVFAGKAGAVRIFKQGYFTS